MSRKTLPRLRDRSAAWALVASLLIASASPWASPPSAAAGESPGSGPADAFDWKQRALDFDRLAFDERASALYLPMLTWPEAPRRHFALPSYVGKPSDGEAICCLAAVMSGSLCGTDKTQDRGVNWVEACEAGSAEPIASPSIM